MQVEQLRHALAGAQLSEAALAERSGIDQAALEDYLDGRRTLTPMVQTRLAAAIRARAAELEHAAALLERDPSFSQAASTPVVTDLFDAPKTGASKTTIALGALGLLMFIVGVKKLSSRGESRSNGAAAPQAAPGDELRES